MKIKLLVAICLLGGGKTLPAQTWTGAGADSDWSNPANWDSGVPTLPAALTFSGNQRLSNSNNWAVGSTISGLTFDSGAGAFVLGGNGLVFGGSLLNNSGTLQTVALNLALSNGAAIFDTGAGGLAISGNLTGNQALTIQGAGNLTLSGSNSYTGAVTVNTAGTIVLGSNYALNRNANFTLNAGYIDTNGYNLNLNGLLGSATTTNGGITNSSAALSVITFGNNGTGVHLGTLGNIAVSGNIALVINTNAGNSVTMNVANTFTGGVTIKDNIWAGGANLIGTFTTPNNWRVLNAGFFGTGTVTFAGNAYMGNNNGGVTGWTNWTNDIRVTGTNNWLAYYTDMNSKGNWSGDGVINIWQGWTPTFTFSGSMANFSGTLNLIGGGANNGGVGRVALTGSATDLSHAAVAMMASGNGLSLATPHYGVSYLLAGAVGTYKIGDLSSLATVTNSASLDEAGFAVIRNNTGGGLVTFEVGNLNKNSTFSGMITDSGSVTVGAAPTFADTHQGKSALTKVGAGTWTLTGANTYSGSTTVSGGVLMLSGTGSINGGGKVLVSGGELAVNSSVALTPQVDVEAGGKLSGSGELAGAVFFNAASAAVTGGGFGTAGTLTFSDEQYWGDFIYAWDILGAAAYDTLSFSHANGLTLTGNVYTLTVSNPGAVDFTELLVIAGAVDGFKRADWSVTAGYDLEQRASGLWLSVTPVPEPSALALLLSGGLALAWLRRRR